MRVLGIETSSLRGTVALVEDGRMLAWAHHEEPNRHGERLLTMIDGLLDECGWTRSTIERVGVGIGPGSFTGLRVGIALAAGIGLGLGVPVVGVGSLRALAAGHPRTDERLRVVVRDARRNEFFVAAYDAAGGEIREPEAVPRALTWERVQRVADGRPFVLLGASLPELASERSELTEEPDARVVATLAAGLDPTTHPALPHYVRGANAIRPQLPVSPLTQPRAEPRS